MMILLKRLYVSSTRMRIFKLTFLLLTILVILSAVDVGECGIFKKIGKAIKKVGKGIGKGIGKVAKFTFKAAPKALEVAGVASKFV
ncbi:unnamed protein product [Cylicocyclus nassatus]|uniref:Uncharacterized protein n=1 Tax=Cylicocyclus nassatus TaxID=53992 RepID=A0AA36LZN3_CYLNA|nr:unnamed protein product [Cylicocyclus nassatus]